MTERERLPWMLCAITAAAMLFFAYCWATVKPTVVEIEKRVEVPKDVIKTVTEKVYIPDVDSKALLKELSDDAAARANMKSIEKAMCGHWFCSNSIRLDSNSAFVNEGEKNAEHFIGWGTEIVYQKLAKERLFVPYRLLETSDADQSGIVELQYPGTYRRCAVFFNPDHKSMLRIFVEQKKVVRAELLQLIDERCEPKE